MSHTRTGNLREEDMTSVPEFAHTWFDEQAAPLWEEYLLPLASNVDSYLEIGCADGASMYWIMTKLKPSGQCWAIDPWETQGTRGRAAAFKAYRQRFQNNLCEWIDSGQLEVFVAQSFDVFREKHAVIPDESVDLVYVDGAHRAWDTLGDLILSWPKVKCGGIVVVDDCQRRWLNGKPLVLPAVHAFVSAYDSRYRVHFWEPRQIAFEKIK